MWTSVNMKILCYVSRGLPGGREAAAPGGRVRDTGRANGYFKFKKEIDTVNSTNF